MKFDELYNNQQLNEKPQTEEETVRKHITNAISVRNITDLLVKEDDDKLMKYLTDMRNKGKNIHYRLVRSPGFFAGR